MCNNSRKATTKILEAMDAGTLDPKTVAEACLTYMSEDDVSDMLEAEELLVVES